MTPTMRSPHNRERHRAHERQLSRTPLRLECLKLAETCRRPGTDSGEWRIYYFVGHPGERKTYPSLCLKPKNFRSVGTYSENFPDALVGTNT